LGYSEALVYTRGITAMPKKINDYRKARAKIDEKLNRWRLLQMAPMACIHNQPCNQQTFHLFEDTCHNIEKNEAKMTCVEGLVNLRLAYRNNSF